MQPFILLFFILLIFVCAFGYMIYHDALRRAREKKQNHIMIESKKLVPFPGYLYKTTTNKGEVYGTSKAS